MGPVAGIGMKTKGKDGKDGGQEKGQVMSLCDAIGDDSLQAKHGLHFHGNRASSEVGERTTSDGVAVFGVFQYP